MSSTRKLMDTPGPTRNHLGASNSTVTTPGNTQLTNPSGINITTPSTPGTSTGALGNRVGAYFQAKNAGSQTPASTGLQRQFPTSNGATARGGGGGAAAIQAGAEAASGVVGGIHGSWQIGQNAIVTNNWFNNVSGVNGMYNGMHDRASMQAAAEQRGIDRANNYANTGKAVAGPLGYLAGYFIGKGTKDTFQKDELAKTNFKTMSTTDQQKIDAKDGAISTSREPMTQEQVKQQNQETVHNRNLAYGYGGKPSPPTLDEKDSLEDSHGTKMSDPIPTGAQNHELINNHEEAIQDQNNVPNMITL